MIELNKLTYNSNVAALSAASQGIKKSKEQPEITGDMKTLEAFLETYQTLSELFGSYKTLLQEDVGNYGCQYLYDLCRTILNKTIDI